MSTVVVILLFALGFAMVVKGGDIFVSASISIASHLRVPEVVIGSTLVSIATTCPEMAVSATASFRGESGIALGNALGSAIANIGLIVGILVVLRPMEVKQKDFLFPAVAMLCGGLLLAGMTASLHLSRISAWIILACGGVYLIVDYARHRRDHLDRKLAREAHDEVEAIDPDYSMKRSMLLFALGAILVLVGSRLLADNAVTIAELLGVPSIVIGLTLVALGTSLPELVTAVAAAKKGVPELSLGNVVGANIMNVTFIPGISGAIGPLSMARWTQCYNMPAMVLMFVLLLVMGRTQNRLSRGEGVVLLTLYGVYVVGLFAVQHWVGGS